MESNEIPDEISNEIPNEIVNNVSMQKSKNVKYPTKMKQFQPKNEKKIVENGIIKIPRSSYQIPRSRSWIFQILFIFDQSC